MKKLFLMLSLILVVVCFSDAGFAQGFGLKGIGGRVGLVIPEHVDATFTLAAHANLGEVAENIVIFPSIDYWGGNNWSQFGFNADGRYYIPASEELELFAGGGLGFIFTHVDLGPFGDDTSLDIGLNLFGGIDFPIGENLLLTAEGRFVLSDIYSFRITGGITFLLGQ